ncbi:MAG: acyl-CoA thioesterase [Xanthomonadales bacterium]|nr:acyl-CoA thioesterase [Xanthomonadales bacterium]
MSALSVTDIEVRWGDMDAFGHVNNTVYLRYMEVARIRWLESLEGAWDTPDFGPALVNVNCNFRREIRYPCTVRVHLEARRASDKRLLNLYRFCDAGDESVVYADGEATLVWIDKRSRKSIPLPAPVANLLGVTSC